MGLEAGRCCGLFINDVNISGKVDDSYLYKVVTWGREGLKSQEKLVTSFMDVPLMLCFSA